MPQSKTINYVLDKDDPKLEAYQFGAKDPVWWIQNVLKVRLYSRARDMVEAVYKYDKVGVWSGHGVSKSFTMACVSLWWMLCMGGLVLVTGPKFLQTKDIFFAAIRKVLAGAGLPPAQTPRELPDSDKWELGPEQGIQIINSAEHTAVNVQGYHAKNIMMIADEASGIGNALFDAIESSQVSRGVAGARAKKVYTGNPNIVPGKIVFQGVYGKAQHLDEGLMNNTGKEIDPDEWVGLHISAYDSPNVTGEMTIAGLVGPKYIEDRKVEYGEDSMLYSIRVLGEYFEGGAVDRLVPEAALQEWMERTEPVKMQPTLHWGILEGHFSCTQGFDGARYGDDACVSAIMVNGKINEIEEKRNVSTSEAAIFMLNQHKDAGCVRTSMDGTGHGAGIYDDANLLVHDQDSKFFNLGITMVNFASSAMLARYRNIRTQMGFDFRDAIRSGYIVLDKYLGALRDKLIDDIRATGYILTDLGTILEPKEVIKLKLGRSPDYFDATMLAFHAYIRSAQMTEEAEANLRLANAIRKQFGGAVYAGF